MGPPEGSSTEGSTEQEQLIATAPEMARTDRRTQYARLKYISLLLLLLQNASVIIFTRVAKQQKRPVPFLNSAAVLAAEAIKMLICSCIMCHQHQESIKDPWQLARRLITEHGATTLKCSVPALCYTAQNFIIYYALGNLEIVVFQLLYQSKLLMAAPFSILILGKKLNAQNWAALGALFTGLVIVQLSQHTAQAAAAGGPERNFTAGVVTALMGSALSAFAGVYFEALLKGNSVSLWGRNLQLCLFTVPLSLMTVFFEGYEHVAKHGLFGGFFDTVWLVVLLQAVGGLLVAACLKYADNIVKNFATGSSIVIGGLVSILVFGFPVKPSFVLGGAIVLCAVPAYDPSLFPCIGTCMERLQRGREGEASSTLEKSESDRASNSMH